MNVADSLPMALVLCDLEDTTGRPLTDPDVFDVLLATAMIVELDLAGRLVLHPEDHVSIRGGAPDTLLEPAEHVLSARPMPFTEAIREVAALDVRHTVHSHLVGLGALKVETTRRWFRSATSTWPTADPTVEQGLRDRIREHVASAEGPRGRLDILLALLEVAGLLSTIFDTLPQDRIDPRVDGCPWAARARRVLDPGHHPDLRIHG